MNSSQFFQSVAIAAVLALAPAVPLAQGVSVGIGISVRAAPPALPVYEQPALPGPGYFWMPGYWAWADGDYYWVPGTWVRAPQPGFLWTPGYWGWSEGFYLWHGGYWGPHIGYYGGVNYGFGYVGTGYVGGSWRNGAFFYNRAVNNVSNAHITNVYNETIVNNVTVNRVSYSGGAGGTRVQPTAAEQAAAHEQHIAPMFAQTQHEQAASSNQALRASVNHGAPAVAATPKPGMFEGQGVVAAHKAPQVQQTSARAAASQTTTGQPARTHQPRAATPADAAKDNRDNRALPQQGRPQPQSRPLNPGRDLNRSGERARQQPGARREHREPQ